MARKPAAPRGWNQDVATLVAVVGLLVTMVFNTLGVWQQVKQSKLASDQAHQTRVDTQIQLVTQLNALSADAERDVVAAGVDIAGCNAAFKPTAQQRAAVARAARYYDFLAWLFNKRQVVLRSAQRYAQAGMNDIYLLAGDTFGFRPAQKTYPELRRFRLAMHGALRDPCAGR